MALSERSRTALYQGFSAVVDEEAVQEMLSFFPARDVEEPVTKEFLRAEMAAMELRMTTGFRQEIRSMVWLNVGMLTAFAAVIIAAVRI